MIKMIPTALRLLFLSALLLGPTELVWCAEKTSKLAPVRIAYVSRSILDMPYVIARERGFFREEGLDVGDCVTVELIGVDPERGFIDFRRL